VRARGSLASRASGVMARLNGLTEAFAALHNSHHLLLFTTAIVCFCVSLRMQMPAIK